MIVREVLAIGERVAVAGQHALDHRLLRKVQENALAQRTCAGPRRVHVVKRALDLSASALIMLHNHPSGDPSPSRDDVALTRRLAATGVVVGIPVLDHLILGDEQYCSLKDMGLL